MIDDDDAPQGVVLGRREAVRLLGLFGVGLFGAEIMSSCAPWEARGAQPSRIFSEGGDQLLLALREQDAGFGSTFNVVLS